MSFKTGSKENPMVLKTPPLTSKYTMRVDQKEGKDILVCSVGKTILHYNIDYLHDLHEILKTPGDWIELGSVDEQKSAKEGTNDETCSLWDEKSITCTTEECPIQSNPEDEVLAPSAAQNVRVRRGPPPTPSAPTPETVEPEPEKPWTYSMDGTQTAIESTQYWADVAGAGFDRDGAVGNLMGVGASILGCFSVLWTPELVSTTFITVAMAGMGSLATRAAPRVASVAFSRTFAFAGSYETGVSTTEVVNGETSDAHIYNVVTLNFEGGRELSSSERAITAFSASFCWYSVGSSFASSRGLFLSGTDLPVTTPIGLITTLLASQGNPPINRPAVVGNRPYSDHALDWMLERGIPPSGVENSISISYQRFSPCNTTVMCTSDCVRVVVDLYTSRVATTYWENRKEVEYFRIINSHQTK